MADRQGTLGMPKTTEQAKIRQGASDTNAERSVECLGIKFANDEMRPAYFTEKLRAKLKNSEFCKSEGFPIGDDEDILALSDPPYYTACPNPFMNDYICMNGIAYDSRTDTYSREPFAADVSEGKMTRFTTLIVATQKFLTKPSCGTFSTTRNRAKLCSMGSVGRV
jgi:hypothetical protein